MVSLTYIYIIGTSLEQQHPSTNMIDSRSITGTQSLGKILVSASRMAFHRARGISEASSVCVRSVVRNMNITRLTLSLTHSTTHSLDHPLTHSLESTLKPTNQQVRR